MGQTDALVVARHFDRCLSCTDREPNRWFVGRMGSGCCSGRRVHRAAESMAVDHAVHQRDVRELGGLRSATFAAALLTGMSMAGVLPTFGFIAKETWHGAVGHVAGAPFLALSVMSNVGLVAAAGLVCVKPFFGKYDRLPACREQSNEEAEDRQAGSLSY